MNKSISVVVLAVLLGVGLLGANEMKVDTELVRDCLGCHAEQRLPDNLIYRRYLLKYSSTTRIEKALATYLLHPDKSHSIMPSEFFLRFPMKEPNTMNKTDLDRSVKSYMEYFDVRRRLRLKN